VDDRIQYLEQIRKEVNAALLITAKEMRSGGPDELSYMFHKDDLVLLEATNLQTTHPKVKLAPRRYGPFKVIWASPTNCKLQLPKTMRVHPVFHNSLLKPYHETQAHGPNFERPPPEIVGGEEGHYEIDKILAARPTRNCKSTQYFVHWKGYTDADNSWIPAGELTHTKELLAEFHARHHPKEGIRIQALQAQGDPKEGILLRAILAPPSLSYKPVTSASRDRGDISHDPTHDSSRDPFTTRIPRDLSARDPGNLQPHDPGKITHDLSRNWSSTMSPDKTRFGRASNPLIDTWQIVGTINKTRPLNNQRTRDATRSMNTRLIRARP